MSETNGRMLMVCFGILILGFMVVISISEEYKQRRCIEAIKTQNQVIIVQVCK